MSPLRAHREESVNQETEVIGSALLASPVYAGPTLLLAGVEMNRYAALATAWRQARFLYYRGQLLLF